MRVGSVQYRYTVPCRDHLGAICGRSEYARCGVRDGAHAAANQPSASQSTAFWSTVDTLPLRRLPAI